MNRKLFSLLTIFVLLMTLAPMASGATPAPEAQAGYQLPTGPATERPVSDAPLTLAEPVKSDMVRMWVELEAQPLAARINEGGPMLKAAQESYLTRLDASQSLVAQQAQALGAVELARTRYLLNSVAVLVPADNVAALRALPGVKDVYPVVDGVVDLEASVPWIGAPEAWDLGYTGEGVTIGIIDTGIDYTHAAFGGPGTVLAYTQATTGTNASVITDTFAPGWMWPTDTIKVVGGYDFTGPTWDDGMPDSAMTPDPDPLDDGPAAGHGTHVASIAAGWEVVSGTDVLVGSGVAPDAELYAYKVCSSNSNACNGIAMIQAMEQAYVDGVDVINMSIGATFGGAYDSQSRTVAATNAAAAGILVATSCGNSGNVPYVTGAPGASSGVLATAASYSGGLTGPALQVNAPASIADTYLGKWVSDNPAPIPAELTKDVVYVGLGCDVADYPPGLVVTDTIALIQRGACSFAAKSLNAQAMGAAAAVIFNNIPDDEPFFTLQNAPVNIPVMAVWNDTGLLISNTLASEVVNASMGLDITRDRPEVADVMADFSSRGPRIWDNGFKPNVTAPGANIAAADVGTGTGAAVRGGTSQASPHNAGTMALLREKYPDWPIERIYNAIMNTTKQALYIDENGGTRAPIARQGAGLIQPAAALETNTLAWDDDADFGLAALSYGYQVVADTLVMTKTVRVWNLRESATPGMYRTYGLGFTNIFTDDEGAGVTVELSTDQLMVTDGMSETFDVVVTVDAAGLKEWDLYGGGNGNNGNGMTDLEFDGYVNINELGSGATDAIALPLYLLPHKAADVTVAPTSVDLASYGDTGAVTLTNSAAYTGTADFYAWMVDDPTDDAVTGTLDIDQVGVRSYFNGLGEVFEFAIVAEEARAHPYTVQFNVYIDTNGDLDPDYMAWNVDYSLVNPNAPLGLNIVVLSDLATGGLLLESYNGTDFNSKAMRFVVYMGDLGLTDDASINFYVEARDNYNDQDEVDTTDWVAFDGYNPKFYTTLAADVVGSELVNVYGWEAGHFYSPDQMGILVLYQDQELEAEGVLVNVADTGASDCPADGRTDVGAQESLPVLFSAPVVTGTVEFKLQLYEAGTGTLVLPVDVAWDATEETATITPQSPLLLGQGYMLSHEGGTGQGGEVFTPKAWVFYVAKYDTYLPIILR